MDSLSFLIARNCKNRIGALLSSAIRYDRAYLIMCSGVDTKTRAQLKKKFFQVDSIISHGITAICSSFAQVDMLILSSKSSQYSFPPCSTPTTKKKKLNIWRSLKLYHNAVISDPKCFSSFSPTFQIIPSTKIIVLSPRRNVCTPLLIGVILDYLSN